VYQRCEFSQDPKGGAGRGPKPAGARERDGSAGQDVRQVLFELHVDGGVYKRNPSTMIRVLSSPLVVLPAAIFADLLIAMLALAARLAPTRGTLIFTTESVICMLP